MRQPEWLKVKLTGTHNTKKILRNHNVSTVCEEARCPNQGKCFSNSTATFMILGDRCTRDCAFCAVEHAIPFPPDPREPERVAEAAVSLGLRFAVITSVSRDDLPDKGGGQFAATVQCIKKKDGMIRVEILTPDFQGDVASLRTALDSAPDVFNHNIETVPNFYPAVRPRADYRTSLFILKTAKELHPDMKTKSGLMVGLGEKKQEILDVMYDLREAGCDFLTIGQYLQPRKNNIAVAEYIHPEVFEYYSLRGREMGFLSVSSSPLTRSSMDADRIFKEGLNYPME